MQVCDLKILQKVVWCSGLWTPLTICFLFLQTADGARNPRYVLVIFISFMVSYGLDLRIITQPTYC